MTLPEDLKNFRAPRLLDWVSEEPALILIAALLAAFVVDRLS